MTPLQIEEFNDSLAREYSPNGVLIFESFDITPKQLARSRLVYSRALRSPIHI